jgi:hypothetical protein
LIGKFPEYLKSINDSIQPQIDSGHNKSGLIGVIGIRYLSLFLFLSCSLSISQNVMLFEKGGNYDNFMII